MEASEELLDRMMGSMGPLNFTLFLTLMGERIQSAALQPEDALLHAFQQFDEGRTGVLPAEQLRSILAGGPVSADEVEVLLRDAKCDGRGAVDYRDLVRTLKQSC